VRIAVLRLAAQRGLIEKRCYLEDVTVEFWCIALRISIAEKLLDFRVFQKLLVA